MCVCVCVCVYERASLHACVRARACVCVCVRACVRVHGLRGSFKCVINLVSLLFLFCFLN